jgi:spore germination protein YaaH
VVIMSYAYTTSSSAPGSTAPYEWVDNVAAYAASQFGPEKVLLGLAFYGYDWNLTMGGRAKALDYPQAEALANAYGASIRLDPVSKSATFTYRAQAGDPLPYDEIQPVTGHNVTRRQAPACPLTPKPPTSVPSTPTPTPVPAPVQEHVVWLENAASVAARLEIASRHNVAGVGAWRLGHEDPAVWPVIAEWKR